MKKIQIVSDTNQKSLRIKQQIIKEIAMKKFSNSNIVIVIGGDGFMLKILKKNNKSKKYFYGINSGNYGFLMNKVSSKNIINNLQNLK